MHWRNEQRGWLLPVVGGCLTALAGLLLWGTPAGEGWVNSSYDYLFRFGHGTATNRLVLIAMDNEAYDELDQVRELNWDRGLHAKLLNRLADDRCSLVVFDSFFRKTGEPEKDAALIAAMKKQGRVLLMARQEEVTSPTLTGARPQLPADVFLEAASNNWGVACLEPDLDAIVRRHWPFPAPGLYPSLPWTAAKISGAVLEEHPHEQWLRYYGPKGAWKTLSYRFALSAPTNYFRDTVVFIGRLPRTLTPESEEDKFQVPYSRWTGESVGGVEIMMTMFLNLLNHDWLARAPAGIEAALLIIAGLWFGAGFARLRWFLALPVAAGFSAMVVILGMLLSYGTNYWFPWLVIAGGQIPCALAWAMLLPAISRDSTKARAPSPVAAEALPAVGDYELLDPPFGHGSYGKVWLASNAVGQWQALKVVYRSNFGNDAPYDREFNGIKLYKPISDRHSGLLRVDFVSKKRPDYFYYVMELGDALDSIWEKEPAKYKPLDLFSLRNASPNRCLPVLQCVDIALELIEALDFLHLHGLTHRDIKPQNIIFVHGHAKLADVGLVSDIRPVDKEGTLVGTPGFMPPPPESPGTAQADIYGLGMVLYTMATGNKATSFPEIATLLAGAPDAAAFLALNSVILKACQPDATQRYLTAKDMREALIRVKESIANSGPAK